MTEDDESTSLTADKVMAFLDANPDFLAGLAGTGASSRNKDDKIIDLTPAIAQRARNEARRVGLQNKSMMSLAAENMVNWQRLHHAALALLASEDGAHLFSVVVTQFPTIFDLAACHIVTASPVIRAMGGHDAPHLCSAEQLQAITAGRAMTLGVPDEVLCSVLNRTPQSVAVVRLPDRLADPITATVLVLCGHNRSSFTPDLANDLLVLLAEMVGVALTARLDTLDGEQTQ